MRKMRLFKKENSNIAPPQLFIHVGAGKTGTTAIQEFLFLNEKRLENEGLFISKVGRNNSNTALFHHILAGKICSDSNSQPELLSLWNKISKTNHPKTLISSEIFHSLVNHKNGFEFLLRIKKILSRFEIFIIFYIRREDEWLQSAYIEWVKSGEILTSESIYDILKKERLTLPEQILAFSNIFGNNSIIVRPFEKQQFCGGNIFSDFLNIFGIALTDDYVLPIKNSNHSITSDALDFKRIYNTVCKNRQEAQMLMNPLLAYSELVDSNNTKIFKKNNLLSKDERDNILNPLLPLYSKIAKDFLKREEGILFYDLDTNFDSVNSGKNDTSKVIAYLIKELFKENISLRNEIDVLKKELKK